MKRLFITYRDIGLSEVLVAENEDLSFYDEPKLTYHIISDGEDAKEIYLYLGSVAVQWKLDIIERAIALIDRSKTVIYFVACECDWDQKERLAQKYGLNLIPSECTGYDTLPRIVKSLSV